MKIQNLLLVGFLLIPGQSYAAEKERWYSNEQVSQGEKLFRQSCAACHGQNAEATLDWKKTDANGNYPPPPLNGTGHAWHHDLDLLRRTVREGGAKLGGQMPAFEGILSAEETERRESALDDEAAVLRKEIEEVEALTCGLRTAQGRSVAAMEVMQKKAQAELEGLSEERWRLEAYAELEKMKTELTNAAAGGGGGGGGGGALAAGVEDEESAGVGGAGDAKASAAALALPAALCAASFSSAAFASAHHTSPGPNTPQSCGLSASLPRTSFKARASSFTRRRRSAP